MRELSKFNVITIKNYYSLFLITKILNRFNDICERLTVWEIVNVLTLEILNIRDNDKSTSLTDEL